MANQLKIKRMIRRMLPKRDISIAPLTQNEKEELKMRILLTIGQLGKGGN